MKQIQKKNVLDMNKFVQIMNDSNYLDSVEELAETKSEVVFFNSNHQHASIVMGTIFKYANENLKIFAGNLQHDFCQTERYVSELEGFIKRGKSVQILLDELKENSFPESKISKILLRYQLIYPDKVQVRRALYDVIDSKSKRKIHFTTADNKAFRIENNTVDFTAKCCFNDAKQVATLNRIFDDIFSNNDKSINLFS